MEEVVLTSAAETEDGEISSASRSDSSDVDDPEAKDILESAVDEEEEDTN